MPARGDLRPAELTRPSCPSGGKLGSLRWVGEQVNDGINGQLLGRLVFDAEVKAARFFPRVRLVARNLDAELNAISQSAEVGRDRNAPAGLGLPDRDRTDHGESSRMAEEPAALGRRPHLELRG